MDISLLPEEMRGKEEEERKKKNNAGKKSVLLSAPPEDRPAPLLVPLPAPPRPAPPPPQRPAPPAPKPALPAPPAPLQLKRSGNGRSFAPPPPAAPRREGPVLRVSLIPHDGAPAKTEAAGRRAVIMALILGAAAVGLPAAALMGIGAAREARVRSLETEIAGLNGKIREAESALAPVREAERAVKSLSLLLNGHRRTTAAFSAIERATIPEVSYIQLSSEGERGFSLQAVAPNFEDVARQIVALRQSPDFDAVKVQSAAADVAPSGEVRSVSFSVSLSLKPEVLVTDKE